MVLRRSTTLVGVVSGSEELRVTVENVARAMDGVVVGVAARRVERVV